MPHCGVLMLASIVGALDLMFLLRKSLHSQRRNLRIETVTFELLRSTELG